MSTGEERDELLEASRHHQTFTACEEHPQSVEGRDQYEPVSQDDQDSQIELKPDDEDCLTTHGRFDVCVSTVNNLASQVEHDASGNSYDLDIDTSTNRIESCALLPAGSKIPRGHDEERPSTESEELAGVHASRRQLTSTATTSISPVPQYTRNSERDGQSSPSSIVPSRTQSLEPRPPPYNEAFRDGGSSASTVGLPPSYDAATISRAEYNPYDYQPQYLTPAQRLWIQSIHVDAPVLVQPESTESETRRTVRAVDTGCTNAETPVLVQPVSMNKDTRRPDHNARAEVQMSVRAADYRCTRYESDRTSVRAHEEPGCCVTVVAACLACACRCCCEIAFYLLCGLLMGACGGRINMKVISISM